MSLSQLDTVAERLVAQLSFFDRAIPLLEEYITFVGLSCDLDLFLFIAEVTRHGNHDFIA